MTSFVHAYFDSPAIVAAPSRVEYNPPQPQPNRVYAYVVLNRHGDELEMIEPETGEDGAMAILDFYTGLWPDSAPHTLHTLYIGPALQNAD